MSAYEYAKGPWNVDTLTAPYALLAKALRDDGRTQARDEWKQMFQWIVQTPAGPVDIYDYKIGDCYDADGLTLTEMMDGRLIEWHVQGDDEAIADVLRSLEAAASASGER